MKNAQNSLDLDLFVKQTLHVSKAGSGRRRRQLSLRRVCVALAGQGQAAGSSIWVVVVPFSFRVGRLFPLELFFFSSYSCTF